MSTAFVGEVRAIGFNFAPIDWMLCNGQTVPISGYDTLYALIGTTYGGDGQSNFNLPNLQGRLTVHQGSSGASNYIIGQSGGVESVTLTVQNYPAHSHNFMVSGDNANTSDPKNATLASGKQVFSDKAPSHGMSGAMIGSSGGGALPHDNMQPYLALNWVIAMNGIFPNRP
jgi:microcystin-dependent protein